MDIPFSLLDLSLHRPPEPETGLPNPARRGGLCPLCGSARLDYNGLLELECPACGFVEREGAGCT